MSYISPLLTQSFAQHRGTRGAHFYDSNKCEFVSWDSVVGKIKDNLPETFYEKLVEAIANYDPESEFVTVSAGGGQLTIELFKSHDLD
jgi:hypothetical protein